MFYGYILHVFVQPWDKKWQLNEVDVDVVTLEQRRWTSMEEVLLGLTEEEEDWDLTEDLTEQAWLTRYVD